MRIVLWFEEIYKFNRISNILYKESILEHKRNKLFNITTLLCFFILPNISWAWWYLGETWQKKIMILDLYNSPNWVGASVLGYATKTCFGGLRKILVQRRLPVERQMSTKGGVGSWLQGSPPLFQWLNVKCTLSYTITKIVVELWRGPKWQYSKIWDWIQYIAKSGGYKTGGTRY